ncbi:MAG: hypothetical protein ABI858_09245 [Pseudoxanthomonas sp.]
MLRIGLALLLTCACAQAMAQNGRHPAADTGGCPETETLAREDAPANSGSHPKATATRSKYAKPASSVHTSGSGGGGGDDDALPRARAPKWHSFLPGMFR